MAIPDDSRDSTAAWSRDERTKKRHAHLTRHGRRECDGRKVRPTDELHHANVAPTPPLCPTCWNLWISRRNEARRRGEHVEPL